MSTTQDETSAPVVATQEQTTEAHAAASSPVAHREEPEPVEQEQPQRKPDDASPTTVRIAKDSSMRRLITFVMMRVQAGSTVTIQALTYQVQRAIRVATIVRDRIGNVHQTSSLLVVEEAVKPDDADAADKRSGTRQTSGIQIVLSLSELDTNEVGYQKPKPKGYAMKTMVRQRYPPRQQMADDRKSEAAVSEAPGRRRVKSQAPKARTAETAAQEDTAKIAPPNAAGGRQRRRRRPRAASDTEATAKTTSASKGKTQPDKPSQDTSAKRDNSEAQQMKRKRSRKPRGPAKEKTSEEPAAPAEARSEQRGPSQRGGRRPVQNQRPLQQRDNSRPYQGNQERRGPPRRLYEGGGSSYHPGMRPHYMPNYGHPDRKFDMYYNRYEAGGDRRPGGPPFRGYGGPRNPRGPPNNGERPGYFPASRRPQHPDELNDFRGAPMGRRGGPYQGAGTNF